MNRTDNYQHASLFGPPSELIHVGEFLQAVNGHTSSVPELHSMDKTSILSWQEWTTLSEEQKQEIEDECSVDDIKNTLNNTLNSVRSAAHIISLNRATLSSIHTAATAKKRNHQHSNFDAPEYEHPEVTALQNQLAAVKLKSWNLDMNSALLMRTPGNADYNALSKIKKSSNGASSPEDEVVCVITFSVHCRMGRSRNYFTKTSQHAVLSSQSVGDMFEVIPCSSNEIPSEVVDDDGTLTGYAPLDPGQPNFVGCAVCIEGVIYGDGQSEEDYSDKLLAQLAARSEEDTELQLKKGPCMHDAVLSTLALRVNSPYWLLHAGDCEHNIVIDEIRLEHPSDLIDGYPLTLAIQPIMIDMCRGCFKVPAVWAVQGDIRLGESPCMLCAPCWRKMGMPRNANTGQILVVPLPKYELGW